MWGVGKADVLRDEGASVYVGDHVHDVEGALAAGVVSVSVLTGGCTRDELVDGGHPRRARLASTTSRRGSTTTSSTSGSPPSRRGCASSAPWWSPSAAVPTARCCWPRPCGPSGADQVVAATGYSDSLPGRRARPGVVTSRSRWGCELLTPRTHEMEREGYRANSGERCYFCKAELIETLRPLADEHGIAHVATGTNADDAVAGFRPGIRAAAERGAVTPLLDAGLTKDDVRRASRRWGLPTWDKPAAACLSSRVAYGIEVTPAPAGPRRARRGGRAGRAGRPRAREPGPAGARPRGSGPRIEVDRDLLARALSEGARTYAVAVLAVVATPASTRPRSTPAASAPARSTRRSPRTERMSMAGCPSAPIVCARSGPLSRDPPIAIDTRSRNEEVKAVPSGKVKWFDADKGFGFLSQDGGPDVYVHADALPEG